MATNTKKTKTDTAQKKDTAAKVKDTAVKETPTPEAAKETSTPKGGETTGGETTPARQPARHPPTIVGAKAKSRSPRRTRKTGT